MSFPQFFLLSLLMYTDMFGATLPLQTTYYLARAEKPDKRKGFSSYTSYFILQFSLAKRIPSHKLDLIIFSVSLTVIPSVNICIYNDFI